MPCDPSFLADIKMFELLNEDDRVALAKVVDELKGPADHTPSRRVIPAIQFSLSGRARSSSLSKTLRVKEL